MDPSTTLHQQPTIGSNSHLTQTNDSVSLTLPLCMQIFSLAQAVSWRSSQRLQAFCVRILQPLSLGGWEEWWEEAGFCLIGNAGSRAAPEGRDQMLIPLTSLYLATSCHLTETTPPPGRFLLRCHGLPSFPLPGPAPMGC